MNKINGALPDIDAMSLDELRQFAMDRQLSNTERLKVRQARARARAKATVLERRALDESELA